MYGPDLIRGWAQTLSGILEKTQPNNDESGQKRSIEVVRYMSDLFHLKQFMGKPNIGYSKKWRDHGDKDRV